MSKAADKAEGIVGRIPIELRGVAHDLVTSLIELIAENRALEERLTSCQLALSRMTDHHL